MSKTEILQSIKYLFKVNPTDAKILNRKKVTSKSAKGIWRTRRGHKKVVIDLPSPEIIPGYETFLETKEKKSKTAKSVQKAEK
jgi:ribosomal protein L23